MESPLRPECAAAHPRKVANGQCQGQPSLLGLIWLLGVRSRLDLLAIEYHLHIRSEALVICVLHDLANVDIAAREVQIVFGLGICWEPIFAVDLLAIGDEGRK